MLTAQDAAGARSQKQERRSGVLQEEGRMPEHDRKATNMQKIRERAAVAKHTQVCQELNDPQLHQPQQVVSFLDDLVGEDASLSTVRGGACRSTPVQVWPRQQQHCSQDSHTFVNVSSIL